MKVIISIPDEFYEIWEYKECCTNKLLLMLHLV